MNENEIIDSETLKDAEDTSPQQDNTADEWLANIRHNRPEVHTVPSNLPELSLYGLDNRPVPKSANSFRTKETKSGECAETPLGTVQIEPKGNITLHFHNGDSITFCTNGELLKNGELVKTAKADMSTLRDGGSTQYSYPDGTTVLFKHKLDGDRGIELSFANGDSISTSTLEPGRMKVVSEQTQSQRAIDSSNSELARQRRGSRDPEMQQMVENHLGALARGIVPEKFISYLKSTLEHSGKDAHYEAIDRLNAQLAKHDLKLALDQTNYTYALRSTRAAEPQRIPTEKKTI